MDRVIEEKRLGGQIVSFAGPQGNLGTLADQFAKAKQTHVEFCRDNNLPHPYGAAAQQAEEAEVQANNTAAGPPQERII